MSDDYNADDTSDTITEEEIIELYKQGKLVPAQSDIQTIEDYSSPSQYAGLGGGFDQRLSQTQAQMKYLLGTDEVPEHIRKHRLWALVSRHLQLIRIESMDEMPGYRRDIRQIIRTAMWNRDLGRKVPYSDLVQIEFFAELLLKKSIDRGERVLLATQITRTQMEDIGERSPASGGGGQGTAAAGSGLGGALKRMFGGFLGGGGR
jgi:hypothetical protein